MFQAISEKKVFKSFFFRRSPEKRSSKHFFRQSTELLQFKKYCCPQAEDRAIFEAKDLTIEAKAKDFKMSPRGHRGRLF